MRALFTTHPAIGHLQPLASVARALTDEGHDVAFCSSQSFRAEVERRGFEHFDAGADWLVSSSTRPWSTEGWPTEEPARTDHLYGQNRAGHLAGAMLPDLVAIAERWRPDIIVREASEYAGCLAAEHRGIPHASVAHASFATVNARRAVIAPALEQHRAGLGLSPDPHADMVLRYLHLCFVPRSFHARDASVPDVAHFLRHTPFNVPNDEVPPWVTSLSHDRTVLATMGTFFNRVPRAFETVLAALRDEPVNLLVTVSNDVDPSRFGPQPANVRIERWLPHAPLLPHCDVFVTHGGFNSVKDSLRAGVPMVMLPIPGADHSYAAERCAALGVAEVIDPGLRTPDTIRAAVRHVLEDPAFGQNAQAFGSEMLALPPVETAVELLDQLVRRREPLPLRPPVDGVTA